MPPVPPGAPTSVYVWLVGGTYLVGFRGEVDADPAHPVRVRLDALGTAAAATDGSRRDGITYDDLETLNLALGSGSDVLNVRGTRPVTNVSFGAGDDRVYVSSKAAVGLAEKPHFLAGDLDLVQGTLNLDLGTGRHTLLVSDEDSPIGDTSALLTDVAAAARARDAALDATAEVFLVGLAPAGISWKVAATGTLADGIRIWTGSGADGITVDGTHNRTGVRTTTWLNTGLGNDLVVVSLTQGQDGFLVLNTQGPNDNVLPISPIGDGDEPISPDVVTGITVNGAPLAAGRYVVSSRQDLVGLFDSLLPGDTVAVTLDVRTAGVVRASGAVTVDLATLGNVAHTVVEVRVWVNGVLVSPVSQVGTVLTIAAGTQRDGGASLVVVEVTRRHTETFTLPRLGGPDDDTVDARGSSLPLVVFGGQGADTIRTGTGGDIVVGDRGRVLWFTPGTVPVSGLGGVVLDAAALAALEAVATAVSGHGGFGDTTDGVEGLVGIVVTVDPTIGGADTITTGLGSDIVLGGAAGDSITTNDGETAGTPDQPNIVIADHGFVDTVLLDGDPADLDRIWSTDVTYGGDDTVTTGNGDDVIIGGTGGDTIRGGDGRNIVVGDNGRFTAIATETRSWGQLPLSSGRLETVSPTVGGADTITTGNGIDIVLGGALGDTIDVGAGNDLVLGDHPDGEFNPDGLLDPGYPVDPVTFCRSQTNAGFGLLTRHFGIHGLRHLGPHRLRLRGAGHRHRSQGAPPRPGRLHAGRRLRLDAPSRRTVRFLPPRRILHRQRHTGTRQPALRQHSQWLCARRRRGLPRARGMASCPGAGRPHLRRAGRRRQFAQQLSYHRFPSLRRRPHPGHAPGPRRRRARVMSTTSMPTALPPR